MSFDCEANVWTVRQEQIEEARVVSKDDAVRFYYESSREYSQHVGQMSRRHLTEDGFGARDTEVPDAGSISLRSQPRNDLSRRTELAFSGILVLSVIPAIGAEDVAADSVGRDDTAIMPRRAKPVVKTRVTSHDNGFESV